MLSEREKQEMRDDGRSLRRREEFAQSRKFAGEDSISLDNFIQFLTSIQKAFFPFFSSSKTTITRKNRL